MKLDVKTFNLFFSAYQNVDLALSYIWSKLDKKINKN